jgi:hypothetical protein
VAANCGTGEEGRQPEDAPRTAVSGKISGGGGRGDETMQDREPRMEPRWKRQLGRGRRQGYTRIRSLCKFLCLTKS